MADSMVTGRMTQAKKAAGNRVLASLGLNASQAINQLYDHLIDQRSLPFGNTAEHTHPVEEREQRRVRSSAASLARIGSRAWMTIRSSSRSSRTRASMLLAVTLDGSRSHARRRG